MSELDPETLARRLFISDVVDVIKNNAQTPRPADIAGALYDAGYRLPERSEP